MAAERSGEAASGATRRTGDAGSGETRASSEAEPPADAGAAGASSEVLAELPAPPQSGASTNAVRFEVTTIDLGIELPASCDVTAVASSGLPAARDDGQRVAYLEQSGPANADEPDLDHELVILDRSGAVRDRVRLWTAAEVETLATSTDCTAWRRTMEARAKQARAALEGRAWRTMPAMAMHLDRVRDLGATAAQCRGFVPPAVAPLHPGHPPLLLTCNNRPQTLEVAVVAGPALVVRIPGVEVLRRQAEPGLQVKVVDEWEPGACSGKPTLDAAWRDAASGLVLLRIEGEDYGMDSCDYAEQYRVLDLPSEGWPELPWSRQASSVERTAPDLPATSR